MRASRTMFLAGAVALALSLLTGISQATSQPTQATASSGTQSLEEALPKASDYPDGTTINRLTVADAIKGSYFSGPAGLKITPSVCNDLTGVAVGSIDRLSGSVQLGTTRDGVPSAVVLGTADSGVSLDAVRKAAADCRAASVVLPDGTAGTLNVRLIDGLRTSVPTIGIQKVYTFPNNPSQNVTDYQYYAQPDGVTLLASCQPNALGAQELGNITLGNLGY